MNKVIKFGFAVLAIVFSIATCTEATAQTAVAQEVVKSNSMSMKIEGMTCAMGCARAIEVELNNLEGVEKARVDFDAAKADLTFNASVISEAAIVDFVNKYRKGAFKASVDSAKKCGAECTKPCCAKTKTSCSESKKQACSAEQKAKCEAAKKSCGSADKAKCDKAAKKACGSADKAAKKSCCSSKKGA